MAFGNTRYEHVTAAIEAQPVYLVIPVARPVVAICPKRHALFGIFERQKIEVDAVPEYPSNEYVAATVRGQ